MDTFTELTREMIGIEQLIPNLLRWAIIRMLILQLILVVTAYPVTKHSKVWGWVGGFTSVTIFLFVIGILVWASMRIGLRVPYQLGIGQAAKLYPVDHQYQLAMAILSPLMACVHIKIADN